MGAAGISRCVRCITNWTFLSRVFSGLAAIPGGGACNRDSLDLTDEWSRPDG